MTQQISNIEEEIRQLQKECADLRKERDERHNALNYGCFALIATLAMGSIFVMNPNCFWEMPWFLRAFLLFQGGLSALWIFQVAQEFLREPIEPHLRQKHDRLILLMARTDKRPPILLLRSFSKTDLLLSPRGSTYIQEGLSGLQVSAGGELMLAQIIEPLGLYGMPVLLGDRPFSDDQICDLNLLPLPCGDHNWRGVFEKVAYAASALVVIPEETEGVAAELLAIAKAYWSKTLILMPPLHHPKGEITTGDDSYEKRWERVRVNLREFGIELPSYRPQGMLYIPDPMLQPQFEEILGEWSIDSFSLALGVLFPKLSGTSEPLREVLQKLDMLVEE